MPPRSEAVIHDGYAIERRKQYRKHKSGLPSSWEVAEEAYWRRDPKDWAWLNEEYNSRGTEFLTLAELRVAVGEAGIPTQMVYKEAQKTHDMWPSNPNQLYGEEWVSYYDLLGKSKPVYLSYAELQKEVRLAGIDNQIAYREEYKNRSGWAPGPDNGTYDEWVSWLVFFGRPKPDLIATLDELRERVRSEDVLSKSHYDELRKKHPEWPSNPKTYYEEEEFSWGEFLGVSLCQEHRVYRRAASRCNLSHCETCKFLSLGELRKEVESAGLTLQREYQEEATKHSNWPRSPREKYKDEWVSWYDLLSKEKPDFLPTLAELRQEVKAAGVTSTTRYFEAKKARPSWPATPKRFYDDWVSWHDLFGRSTPSRNEINWLTLPELRTAVREAGILDGTTYKRERKKHPLKWPSNPNIVYEEWVSWDDLCGAGNISAIERAQSFLSYDALVQAARAAGVTSGKQYKQVQKDHPEWASNPNATFKAQWTGWYDFLGLEKPNLLTLYQLREAVRAAGIAEVREYNQESKNHPDWPGGPHNFYKDEWVSWPDLLGG